MSTQPRPFITPEEYLEIERKAEFKSEYYQGVMYAMAGVRRAHNLVAANLYGELRDQLRSRPCEFYPSEMRVRVSSTGLYTYPDASALCAEPEFADGEFDTLLNPSVIFEVLSPSTEAYDRGFKFELYQTIPSLREYVLISSDHVHVDLFRRQPDGNWILIKSSNPEDTMELQSIDCRLKLADLYEKVEFESPTPRLRSVTGA